MPYDMDGYTPQDYSDLAADVAAIMFPMGQSMYRRTRTAPAREGK